MHLTEDTLVFEKGFEFAVYPYVAKVQENDETRFTGTGIARLRWWKKAKADTCQWKRVLHGSRRSDYF